MNSTFLEAVAKDLLQKYGSNLSRIAVVFPNKRASLFMNEYLARLSDGPLWSPCYTTISDLFREKSELMVADPIKLVCDLYRSYTEITGKDETLDRFYGWGQLLLADFDDIDKNMADAHKVFANLRDIHELDDIDYLSPEQKNILKSFFHNFADDHLSKLKERFLSLWCNLEEIYRDFNQRLAAQGLAYEGALYRSVVEAQADYEFDKYVFVGFNMLQQVEQRLFLTLKAQGKARFYWDFDHYYLANNEAGHYINGYLTQFPNELSIDDDTYYNNFCKPKDITYISSMTESAQAHYISQWISENHRIEAGAKTAIVLCDESLLQTVLHCLPEEVKSINITTGYPLSQSPVASFVQILLRLQTYGHVKNTDKYRLRDVAKILKHPYGRYISDSCLDLYKELQACNRYYPTRSQLALDQGLQLLFTDIDTLGDCHNQNIAQWLTAMLQYVGRQASKVNDPLTQESIFRMYTIINRLEGLIASGDLQVDKITFERLIAQLIQSTTVPFRGEPIEGIQIMGVLETRNLDFDHLLVLSASDNNMPKGVNDSSFIPYSIRKAYGLTTIDHKVAIYAYYFYRLLQRSQDITLTYNKATEDGQTGEMSRFMLQMMVESGHDIRHGILTPDQSVKQALSGSVIKTPDLMNKLHQLTQLSPTAINRYFYCPLTFYYNVVEGLKEPDETDEEMKDSRVFGLIFHRSAELIYQRLMQRCEVIKQADIDDLLNHREVIEMIVDQAFKEELFKVKDNSYTPEYNGLQLINRGVVISYLRKMLVIDSRLTPFRILGLENKVETTVRFDSTDGEREIKVLGIIDRLDEITDDDQQQRIRVIDYKTGMPARKKVEEIAELFSDTDIHAKHTNYYLQALLYALIVSHSQELNQSGLAVSPALMFIQNMSDDQYDPTLKLGDGLMVRATDYEDEFMDGLRQTLREIYDADIPFEPTKDQKRCANCIYSNLCKR